MKRHAEEKAPANDAVLGFKVKPGTGEKLDEIPAHVIQNKKKRELIANDNNSAANENISQAEKEN